MSGIVIMPGKLAGTLPAPPSKSYAHRAVIAAALAKGESRIANLELSQDIEATFGAVAALGTAVELGPMASGRLEATVRGTGEAAEMPFIDCRESGSTLRFLLPVALAVAGGAVFTGSVRLGQRPLGPYLTLFERQGIQAEYTDGGFPLRVRGRLGPGLFTVPGGVSSQFITGLLLALPLLPQDSEIHVEGTLESAAYVGITMDVLACFGIAVQADGPGLYRVAGGRSYMPCDYTVEGDWSQAAFPLLMGLLNGPVSVAGLNAGSTQGDRAITNIYGCMGGDLRWQGGTLTAYPSALRAATVDVSQCPDLAPAVAVAMALADGESRITGGRRLRLKESDRLTAIAGCLNALGARAAETDDGLLIHGKERLCGGRVDAQNDHRIAMMAAAAAPACTGPVALAGHDTVAKSWPGFWQQFKGLGGIIDGQPMG